MTRPMSIDTAGWGPFDPASDTDAACERERHAFTQYVLKRVQKQPKTGSDDASILVGAIIAIVQLAWATNDNRDNEKAREGLHDALDWSWLQCAMMAQDKPAAN